MPALPQPHLSLASLKRYLKRSLGTVALLLFSLGSSRASTLYWDTDPTVGLQSGTGIWSTSATNWSTNASGTGARVAWSNGSDAVFSGSGATVALSGSVAVGNLTFTGSGWSVSSGTLTLSGSSCTIGTTDSATIASALSGSAALVKSGNATLIVSNAFTSFTGPVSLTQGTLELSGGVTLGGTVAIANGALLTTSSAAPGLRGEYYDIQQTGVSPNPNFASLSALSAHLSGTTPALVAYTSGTAFDFGNTGSGFPSPYSSGASNLEVRWTGQFNALVSGTYGFDTGSDDGSVLFIDGQLIVNNNYFQGLTERSGTVVLTEGWHDIVIGYYQSGGGYGLYADMTTPDLVKQRLPTAQLQSAGIAAVGGLTGGTGAAVQIPFGSTLSVATAGTNSFAGAVSGSGAFLLNGAGTFVLTGSVGAGVTTTVASGLLQIGDGNFTNGALGGNVVNNSAVLFKNIAALTYSGTLSGAGTLELSGTAPVTMTGPNSFAGMTQIDSGAVLLLGDGTNTGKLAGSIGDNGTLIVNAPSSFGISGVISGSGSLTKSGAGQLTVGALALSGSMTLSGGTLFISSNPEYLLPSVHITANTTLTAGAGFTLSGAPTIAIDAGATLTINTNGMNVVVPGIISGSGGVTKTGNGTLTLTGSNSYSGMTTENGGTLLISGTTAATGGFMVSSGVLWLSGSILKPNAITANGGLLRVAAGSLPPSGTMTINSTGALVIEGPWSTVNGWLGSGRVAANSTGILALMATGTVSEPIDLTGFPSLVLGATGSAVYTGTLTPANGVYRLGGAGGTLTYTPKISGTASVAIGTVTAYGTVILAGSNTFTGSCIVNGCTLTAGTANALSSGTVTLAGTDGSGNTACLDVNNFTISNPIVLTARSSIKNTGGGIGTVAGPVNGASYYFFPTAAVGSTLLMTGTIGTTRGITCGYTGGGGGQQHGGSVIFAPTTGSNSFPFLTIQGDCTVRANDGVGLSSTAALIINTGIFETGANLIRPLGSGSNAVSFTGGACGFSAYGAPVTVNLGSSATLVWSDTSATGLNVNTLILNGTTATHPLTLANSIDLNGLTKNSRGTVSSNHAVTVNTGTAILSGNLVNSGADSAGLLKQGTGLLVLSGSNSYDGGTSIAAGALQFNSTSAIAGTGANVSVSAGATVAAGYAIDNAFLLRLSNTSATGFTIALAADSANNLDFSAAGAALDNASLGSLGNHNYSGTLTPNGSVICLGGGGGSLALTNPLSGSNSLLVNGLTGGSVTISASSNYTGGTVLVNGGALISGTVSVPAAPTYLTGTLTSSTSASLSWLSHSTNETGFQIERATDGVNFSLSGTVGAGITAFAASSLAPNQTHSFRIRAMNGTSASSYSNVATISTQTPVLTAPTLTAATPDYQWVDLAWTDNGSNERGFVIQQSLDGATYAEVARVPIGVPTVYSAYVGITGTAWFRVAAYAVDGSLGAFSGTLSAVTNASSNVAADLLHRFQLDDGSRTYNVNNPTFLTTFSDSVKAAQRASTTSMLAALQTAVSNTNSTGYTIPAGDYRFSGTGISISNRSNFTIATSGSVNFWYEGTSGGTVFTFTSCTNVSVVGPMTLDAEALGYIEGTILSYDPSAGTLDLQILPGYSLSIPATPVNFLVFDTTGWQLGEFGYTSFQSLGGRVVRLSGVGTNNGSYYQPGSVVAFEGGGPNYQIVGGSSNKNMVFSNMTFYCGTGAPADGNVTGGNVSWVNYRCIPRPGTNRVYTNWPGQFNRNGGTLLFDGCEFDTAGDDGINLLSSMGIVAEQTGPRTLIVNKLGPAVGDVLTFYEYVGYKLEGTAKVVAVSSLTDAGITAATTAWLSTHGCTWAGSVSSWQVTFDQDVNISQWSQFYDSAYGADSVIVRNTAWRNMYAQGVLLQGARQVVVKDNLFQGNFGVGISAQSSQYWQEGKWPTNILFRNNISQRDGLWGQPAIDVYPGLAYSSTSRLIQNITIDGNRIYNPGSCGINVINAANITIARNLIVNPGAVVSVPNNAAGTTVIAGISADAASNLNILNNTVLFGTSGVSQAIYLGPNVDLNTTQLSGNQSGWAQQNAPLVGITSPANNLVTAPGNVLIQGGASGMNGVLSVTLNGTAVSTSDGFAHWTASVPVSLGTNAITAVASDFALPANTASASIWIIGSLDVNGNGLPDSWEAQYGITGGPLADQSGRGVPNLLCYAFGLNPNAPDRSLLPTASVQVKPADGLRYYTFTYRQLIGGGGPAYAVEVSLDAVAWLPAAPNLETISTTPNADGITQTVTVRYLPSLSALGAVRRFFHLRVSSP